ERGELEAVRDRVPARPEGPARHGKPCAGAAELGLKPARPNGRSAMKAAPAIGDRRGRGGLVTGRWPASADQWTCHRSRFTSMSAGPTVATPGYPSAPTSSDSS